MLKEHSTRQMIVQMHGSCTIGTMHSHTIKMVLLLSHDQDDLLVLRRDAAVQRCTFSQSLFTPVTGCYVILAALQQSHRLIIEMIVTGLKGSNILERFPKMSHEVQVWIPARWQSDPPSFLHL